MSAQSEWKKLLQIAEAENASYCPCCGWRPLKNRVQTVKLLTYEEELALDKMVDAEIEFRQESA